MAGSIRDVATLHNGVQMPWLGLGVFKVAEGPDVENSVKWALEAGYRHIDTAALYGNERGVGKAIRESGIPRQEVFVTTKVWNDDIRRGYDAVLRAYDQSLEKLGFDYVDLYLVHWPVKGHYKDAWRALERIYADGRVRAIGVSNFLVHHLEDLLAGAKVVPMVNQVEFHPRLMQKDLMEFCRRHRIIEEAWAPLGQGSVFNIPELQEIARARGKTVAQVVLRWEIQHQVVTIPKSVHRERIVANAQIFDFELSAEEMARIDALDANQRVGADPNNFNF